MNENLKAQNDLAAFHARRDRLERQQFAAAFAKLSDAELLSVARRAVRETLNVDADEMSEAELYGLIEAELAADFGARDREDLTPSELGALADWQGVS